MTQSDRGIQFKFKFKTKYNNNNGELLLTTMFQRYYFISNCVQAVGHITIYVGWSMEHNCYILGNSNESLGGNSAFLGNTTI